MVLPENALHSFPKGCAWTRQNGCRTRIRPQRAMPQPTHRCRVQLFFFFLFPMHTKPGWLAPNQSVSAAETDWFGLNRPIQVKIPKKKKRCKTHRFAEIFRFSLYTGLSADMYLCYCCSVWVFFFGKLGSVWVFVVIYVKKICSLHCWVLGILKLEREFSELGGWYKLCNVYRCETV